MVTTAQTLKILKAKEAFVKFCSHFKRVPRDQLLTDQSFLLYFKDLTETDNVVCTRAFQLALEVSYHKRSFSTKEFSNLFADNIGISDLIHKDSPFMDENTLFSALQAHFMSSTTILVIAN